VRPPEKKFIINWLKAFSVSPGVLFPAAYILLYFGTIFYLNTDYKKELIRSLNLAAGPASRIELGQLHTCYRLDSITVDRIDMIGPVSTPESDAGNATMISITSVRLPVRNVEKLMFSTSDRQSSLDALCRQILSEKHHAQ
jgi:hypothetical protein